MTDFAINVLSKKVPEGHVGVFFLGQAGFIFKTCDDKLIAIDPYLSNCCERYFGFKRLMPKILGVNDLEFDYLIVSHAHYDHFDPDSIPSLMLCGKTELVGANDTKAECERLSINERTTFLSCGDSVSRDDIVIKGVPCDHGELAPDALGLLIEISGKKIYFMGDTAYRPDLLDNPEYENVDLLILPINGAFGNLNEEQAADVASALQPNKAVPCHYWNFAEHGGNPNLFAKAMKEKAPDVSYTLMCQGEYLIV